MEDQIKSLLIHELGHFCVDIIIENEFPDLYIEKLVIRNFGCENMNWCGYVDMKPKELLSYDVVINDINLVSFKLISLISGCVFQQVIAGNNKDLPLCFEFSKKLIGSWDYRKYYDLLFLLRKSNKSYQKNSDKLYKIVNENLDIGYIKTLKDLEGLNVRINELADEEVNKIIDEFNSMGKLKKFEYIYENDVLDALKDRLKIVIEEIRFKELIFELHEKLNQKLKALSNEEEK